MKVIEGNVRARGKKIAAKIATRAPRFNSSLKMVNALAAIDEAL